MERPASRGTAAAEGSAAAVHSCPGLRLKDEPVADNSAKIAEIRAILQSGVRSSTVDGISTALDLESLRCELRRLEAEDDTAADERPRVSQVWLENAF